MFLSAIKLISNGLVFETFSAQDVKNAMAETKVRLGQALVRLLFCTLA